jgi:exopolyphosphatase/guanosine-5'-triphosphate,3'-diphosphate pyrophosphatase
MKIASIDIGTNAIKSKIFKTTPTSIEFVEGIRSPIRLGSDVFIDGILQHQKLIELSKTLREYQNHFIKNNIKMYEIVATSAFRDTQNSEDARRFIENEIEHPVRIISGLEEAKLIRFHPKSESNDNKVFVDVGGGSTEIFMYRNGKHIIQSFQLGAVRGMLNKDCPSEWKRLKSWIKRQDSAETMIGLGGNIRSFLKTYNEKKISTNNLIKLSTKLKKLNTKEKMQKYNLAYDRADVIDHALNIYSEIALLLDVKNIKATNWGVSDSIAVKTFHELYSKKISISRN